MKRNFKGKSVLVATSLFSIFSVAPVFAEPAVLTESKDWRFDVTGYLFLPTSVSGSSTIAGSTADLDMNLKDLLELLDFGASARVEAWKDDFGLIADANYVALGGDGSLTAPIPPNTSLAVDLDIKQTWFAVLGAYQVVKGTYGDSNRKFGVDIQGGARYNTLKQELSVKGGGTTVNLGGTEHWWEPIIGVRGAWELSDTWAVVTAADIAGFGVSEVKHNWSATVAFEYQGWENTSLKFGWRHYSINYQSMRSDGAFGYDVTQSGPVVGLAYSF